MDKFDEKVIGYESTKEILRQILDILKRPEVYKRKGISIPRGLLMESDPGLGKSLLASILMEESERKPFVFRKTSQENSFLDELRTVFAMAKEEAPSILLLEDLNLYVESTSPYAPEWACLQACIDDAKDTDLFVVATTNDTRYMPPSLLRPGRFDYVIYLQPPIGENAEKGFLESTYTVLTTSGIYYQDDHGTTGYLWKDIKEEPRESYHPKIIFKSKDHIFEFGKDREGLELLKKCIKTAQSPMAQKKISNNKINFGSFLCERLHHNLMPSERSAICLAPSSILFSDSEQRGLVPEKDRSLKLHITQDEFILQHESNPFINFIINLENYEISEGEREKHRIIVLTNNFLYLIGGKGQNVAIHVEDICSFRLEKLNESSYIGISSSKMVYSKYLENPAIDMPSLFDHLNQALVIKPSSEGQLPSAQVRPKEMLQSDKIFCPYCGKKIQRNSNFCCFCGSKINYKK